VFQYRAFLLAKMRIFSTIGRVMSETKTTEFAIIETGGKQYKVAAGDVVSIEKLPGDNKEGDKVTFDKVLLVEGKDTKIGSPYVDGAKVEAELVEEGKGKKLNILRFRAKSRYTRRIGHRQHFSKVKITKIA
jgi:large subunit ribosomal protein L21